MVPRSPAPSAADIRLQVDEAGELFILSKSDGMVRYIVGAFVEGDFDFDGDVDGRDFLLWQRNPGVGDLSDWQANYGAGSLIAAVSVPEPTSIAFLCIGWLFFAFNRRKVNLQSSIGN